MKDRGEEILSLFAVVFRLKLFHKEEKISRKQASRRPKELPASIYSKRHETDSNFIRMRLFQSHPKTQQ
jgi:hypothetical protein